MKPFKINKALDSYQGLNYFYVLSNNGIVHYFQKLFKAKRFAKKYGKKL